MCADLNHHYELCYIYATHRHDTDNLIHLSTETIVAIGNTQLDPFKFLTAELSLHNCTLVHSNLASQTLSGVWLARLGLQTH